MVKVRLQFCRASFGEQRAHNDVNRRFLSSSSALQKVANVRIWLHHVLELRRNLFLSPFSSHSRCEIKRAGGRTGKRAPLMQEFHGTRLESRLIRGLLCFNEWSGTVSESRMRTFRWFFFPLFFNFKTDWNHTGGGTIVLAKKRNRLKQRRWPRFAFWMKS